MRNTTKSLIAAGAVSLIALAANGALAQDILIAGAGPITGQLAAFGEQLKRGAELAVVDVNAKGGVLGKKIKIEFGDDQCDPKQAVAVANQLVGKKAAFVDGHFCSGSSIPASAVYNEGDVLQISPASTNPAFTEEAAKKGWINVFRVVGRDDAQGQVAGKFLATQYKGKKVAILHDKSAYGKGLADETKKALNALGQQEVIYDSITAGDKDFSALVSKLKQAGVDVVYFGGYHTEAGLLLRQSRDQGFNAQFISGDAQNSEELAKIAGNAADGFLFTFAPDPRNNPAAKDAVEKFKKAGYDPEGYTLYSYAAIQVWADAANKAKSTKTADVSKALKTGSYETVVGKIEFDAKGDVKNPEYVFYVWKNGKYAEDPSIKVK